MLGPRRGRYNGFSPGFVPRHCALLTLVHAPAQPAGAMAFMLLMVEPIGQRQARTPEQGAEAYASMVRWGQSLQQRGLLIASESLESHSGASRLQKRDGRLHVIDGPFPETKEMIGGFFLINCATRAEAMAIAGECPAAEWLTVEVRGIAACADESTSPS